MSLFYRDVQCEAAVAVDLVENCGGFHKIHVQRIFVLKLKRKLLNQLICLIVYLLT